MLKARSTVLALLGLMMVLAGTAVPVAAGATRVPGCVAGELHVARDGSQGAAGHRFDLFQVTNVGTRTCRLFGYPTFWFRNAAGEHIGFPSVPAGQPARVVQLAPRERTHITVGTVDPSVTLPAQCHVQQAGSVDIRLPYRPHVYRRSLVRDVCTTMRYRPTSYPVGF